MAVTDKAFLASIVMSAAFFLFGNESMADAQNGTSSAQDTGGATQKSYHPEHGEVLLGELRVAGFPTRREFVLDPRLSILVTDVDTTKQIKFSEVMDQLVAQGGDSSLTKFDLFRQWWNTADLKPGLFPGPHCDDKSAAQPVKGIPDYTAFSTLNGFPYRCPRPEKSEASINTLNSPFDESADAGYIAIAFSNRFDLISPDFQDCGEYRIVFARNSGKAEPGVQHRILINFEARVPNPDPTNGIQGCHPILDFWHGLSDPSISASDRGKKLHDFYLNGLPGDHVGPVVDIAHYTFGTGQIRTNQFLPSGGVDFSWTLREFKTDMRTNRRLQIVPDTAKTSPGNDLFRCGPADPRVASLTQDIRNQIANGKLLGTNINSIGFSISPEHDNVNAFEGDEWNGDAAKLGDVRAAFLVPCADGTTPNPVLSQSIQDALTAAGPAASDLTPKNIVDRIRTQTCAGCHHYSGNGSYGPDDLGGRLAWPDKAKADHVHPELGGMDFTQVSERNEHLQDNRTRYGISKAVEKFLEHREAFMKKALGIEVGTDR